MQDIWFATPAKRVIWPQRGRDPQVEHFWFRKLECSLWMNLQMLRLKLAMVETGQCFWSWLVGKVCTRSCFLRGWHYGLAWVLLSSYLHFLPNICFLSASCINEKFVYLTDLNYGECDEREEEVKSSVFLREMKQEKPFKEKLLSYFKLEQCMCWR